MTAKETGTILLVEDEALIAMAEASFLEKRGYRVITARSGEEAVEIIDSRPDIRLVLMDIDLGVDHIDGTIAAEQILSRHKVPVVFLSSHTEPEMVAKTEKITSYGYIVKDSGYTVLATSIKMALKLFEANRSIEKHREEAEAAYWEMEYREERLQHVNRILLSLRNINQLITKTEDTHTLLENTCRLLIETSGCTSASIIITAKGVTGEPLYHAGLNRNFSSLAEQVQSGDTPPCVLEALREGKVVIMDSTHHRCPGCPLLTDSETPDCSDAEISGMVTPLRYSDTTYGWIMVSVPTVYSTDPDEARLLREIAGDIAYALHAIALEKEKTDYQSKLIRSREDLRSVLNSIGDAVFTTDVNGIIKGINPAAERLTGWPADDARGEHYKRVFRIINAQTRKEAEDPISRVLRSGLIVGLANHTVLIARDGTEYQIADSASPVKDPEGRISGVVLVFRDVTEEYALRERLRANEDRLAKILNAAQDGTWDWDLNTNDIYFDRRYFEMAGYNMNDFPSSYEEFRRHVHPDDNSGVEEAIKAHLEGKTEQFSVEFRFLMKDGNWMWILGRGKIAEWNDDGSPGRFLGTHTDITRRRQTGEALEDACREKETLMTELRHRVKNSFNIIISMIHLKLGSVENREARECLEEMESRVQALSTLYTQLYQEGNLNTVKLDIYFRDLIASMSALTDTVEIKMDFEEVTAPLKESGTLGLIMTELVTNAVKHSFPDGRGGTITVKLHNDGKDSLLSVENDGVPFPEGFDIDSSSGLGLKMVRAMVGELDGTIDIGNSDETAIAITFPV